MNRLNVIDRTSFSIAALVISLCSLSFAAPPALFYSDLTSGPNTGGQNNGGAFVTIWGKGFGATRGTGYVAVGGGPASNYPIWTDTKISFQLGVSAQTGNIVVTNSNGSSNFLPFTVRSGNIYFVSTDGSNSNIGSHENPWRTIIHAKNTIIPGDIVYVENGVSQTTEDTDNAAVNLGSHGTAANPKALIAYPGATVNIGSPSLERGIGLWVTGGAGGYLGKYWVISQFHLTSNGSVLPGGYGWRIIGNTLTAPSGDGASAAIEGNGSGLRILGNELYNIGKSEPQKLYHNIYIDNNEVGTVASDFEIGWNTIRDSTANRGIQFFSGEGYIENASIHDNVIYNLRGNGININQNTQGVFNVYNNIIYNTAKGPDFLDGQTSYAGILISSNRNASVYLYNNLVYDSGYSPHESDSGLLSILDGSVYIRNNIFYSNGTTYAQYLVPGSIDPVSSSNNLWCGNGAPPVWDTSALNSDPHFYNFPTKDFHLQSDSPAMDAGSSLVNSIVSMDYDGLLRPQGPAYDIGPYEYNSGYTPPPPPGGNPPPPPLPESAISNTIRVYPNPWRGDRVATGITFDQMTTGSTVKIFTTSGRHIRSLDAPSGSVIWDLKNDSGDKVASGIYLYVITNNQGQRVRGKVVVIR
ncbi:MAG: choice-of-anchor Q domain-containing protein [Elusimicrobiota bacterium]